MSVKWATHEGRVLQNVTKKDEPIKSVEIRRY